MRRFLVWTVALSTLALAQTFEVASGEARYRVREELLGTTKGVTGRVVLRGAEAQGEFVVDLRELRSDQARRDNYLRQNTLQTDRFPTATFRPKRVEGLPNPLPRQGRYPVRVVGDLTIRDVTQEVVWEAGFPKDGVPL